MLLQGLDLTNSLFGVLIRFRQEIIALMADIESMFYWDTNRLRCLCCPEGDIEGPPFENQMKSPSFRGKLCKVWAKKDG